jgi:serine/threonine protein kinase
MEPRRRFRFLKQISEGTFGKVYMSEMITDSNFSKIVAIKILHGKWVEHEEIVQRSRDEARVLGLLNHPNIVRVVDLTSIKGKCSVIMEYLDGVDLKNLITYCKENGLPIPLKVILDILESVSSAMYAAYYESPPQSGAPLKLIHRDIKPSNIMLTREGDVKILDFGTAQANFDDREAATMALTFGSAGYMAPERLLLDEKDRPSGDVYSLGVTLYELLTCKRFGKINPLKEKFDLEIDQRIKVCESDIDRYELDSDVRDALIGVLRQMLSYAHEERPNLQQTLNIMEGLSSKVSGISLKKFCRTTVAACKGHTNNPKAENNDPLAGTIIHEDSSRSFSQVDSIEGMDISIPIDVSKRTEASPTIPPSTVTNPINNEPTQKVQPIRASEPVSEPTVKVNSAQGSAPQKSKMGLIIAGIVFLLIGGAAAVLVPPMLDGKEEPTQTNVQTETKTEQTLPKEKKEEISSKDTFNLKGKSGSGTIIFDLPEGKLDWIRVTGPKKSQFEQKIKANGSITLNKAPAGKYKLETDVDNFGTVFRSKKSKDCTVVFSLDKPKKDWTAGDIQTSCK